jgi:PadR family transcriptional regulator PadR
VPDYLGEFEQLTLLALARLGDHAYGVTIRDTVRERAGRDVSSGAIHSTLRRLETKGLGRAALREAQEAFHRMADGLKGIER